MDTPALSSKPIINPQIFKITVFILYCLAVIARAPKIIFPGRFWAEEGGVYVAQAVYSSLAKTFFSTNQGYYSLFNKLAAILAAHLVDLEYAPLITGVSAFLIQLIPAWLLLQSPLKSISSPVAKTAALGCVLFSLPNYESWLNTVNSQFYLAVSVAIILAAPIDRRANIWHCAILALASLTGVVSSLFLMPLYWISAIRDRSRIRVGQAAILTLGALVQVVIILGLSEQRPLGFYPDVFTAAFLAKCILLPLCGIEYTDLISIHLRAMLLNGHYIWLYLPVILAIGGAIFTFKRWHRETQFLLLAGVAILLGSLIGALEMRDYGWGQTHISALGAGRYYFAPNVLFALALLSSAGAQSPDRRGIGYRVKVALLCWILLVGGHEFFNYGAERRQGYFDGPDWRQEVARWRSDTNYLPRMWPCPAD